MYYRVDINQTSTVIFINRMEHNRALHIHAIICKHSLTLHSIYLEKNMHMTIFVLGYIERNETSIDKSVNFTMLNSNATQLIIETTMTVRK